MNIVIQCDFNPAREIIGLLETLYHPKQPTREVWDGMLASYGIKNSSVFENMYKLMKTYQDVFAKHAVVYEEDRMFFTENIMSMLPLGLVLISCFDIHPSWLESIEYVSDDALFQCIAKKTVNESVRNVQDVIRVIKEMEISAENAWHLLLVLENPRHYMQRLIHLIHVNRPAYDAAMAATSNIVPQMMASFEAEVKEIMSQSTDFTDSLSAYDEIIIYPTLVHMMSMMSFDNYVYLGLCHKELHDYFNRDRTTDIDLGTALKIIGDPSKFEILKFLHEAPSYNLEIAKYLDLTAATTSHHMNMLYTFNLVTMKKESKKVMYSINYDTLRAVVDGIEKMFYL